MLWCVTDSGNNIELCLCDKFLDIFEKAIDVDYVFSFSSCGNKNDCCFLSRNNFECYREKQFKANEIKLLNSPSNYMGVSVKL